MSQIYIDITNQQNTLEIDQQRLHQTVNHVLATRGVKTGSVSLVIVDNETIRNLKNQYFGMDMVTDVISFDLTDTADKVENRVEFEIVVNAQRAQEEARRREMNPQAELNLYAVHGLLHQLGFDDQVERDADAMHKMEDLLLEELGFGKVYDSAENHVAEEE